MTHFIPSKRGQQTFKFTYQPPHFSGNTFLPQHAIIPLTFQTAMNSTLLVQEGDVVQEGQMLAQAADDNAVPVHASVPGTVLGFITAELPGGKLFRGVHIETKGTFPLLKTVYPHYRWQEAAPDTLITAVETAGLVNTVAGIVPLAKGMRIAKQNAISRLKVILYDRDPTCALDSFLAQHFPHAIAEGIALIAVALSVSQIELLIPESKQEAELPRLLQALLPEQKIVHYSVKKIYPPNAIHHKLYTEKNAFYIDSYTALSTYDSVVCNQPMLYSYVLLGDETLTQAKVFKIRIGTPICNIITECGGLKTNRAHLILNGLIQGLSVHTADIPIGKGIKSIHIVNHPLELPATIDACGHCGHCLRVCPRYIDPIKTVRALRKQQYTNEVLHNISLCIACSCCSAACTARIPLCEMIQAEAHKRFTYV
ncbi:MAG: 4Fe-4S dicluster domain-containing protein [Treponema sp.]